MVTQPTPTPALTEEDLRQLDAALVAFAVGGVAQVRFTDGRQVTYRSLDELRAARAMVADLLRASRPRVGIFARATRALVVRD